MSITLELPKLSDTMTVATVVKWLKSVGDPITKGEPYADVETDKATTPLISPIAGTLQEIIAPVGSEVPIGGPVAKISSEEDSIQSGEQDREEEPPALPVDQEQDEETFSEKEEGGEFQDGETMNEATTPSKTELPDKDEDSTEKLTLTIDSPTAASADEDPISAQVPTSVKIADAKKALDDEDKLVAKDSRQAQKADSMKSTVGEEPETKIIPISEKREIIPDSINENSTDIHQLILEKEIDASNLLRAKQAINEHFEKINDDGTSIVIGINDIIHCAVCKAIDRVPEINVTMENGEVVMHDAINLSFSVYLPNGTANPVIKDASTKDLISMASESRELINKARAENLDRGDESEPTFSISNLATHGIEYFKIAALPPVGACLAVASTVQKPVIDERGGVTIGQCQRLTLTCDQRAIQVPVAVSFIQNLGDILENPAIATL